MVVNPSMCQQEVDESWVLVQLEGVFPLIGQQCAHIDGKILLVGQR